MKGSAYFTDARLARFQSVPASLAQIVVAADVTEQLHFPPSQVHVQRSIGAGPEAHERATR
jgi:hypothetical protein